MHMDMGITTGITSGKIKAAHCSRCYAVTEFGDMCEDCRRFFRKLSRVIGIKTEPRPEGADAQKVV
jgi:hypothetical protein